MNKSLSSIACAFRDKKGAIRHNLRTAVIWSAFAMLSAWVWWLARRHGFSGGSRLGALIITVTVIMTIASIVTLAAAAVLHRMNKPYGELKMLKSVINLAAGATIAAAALYSLGLLGSLAGFFAMFGGLLLGWSLQAPISGLAAWLLVCLKRPFRPGDRVQFPSMGLTGDIESVDSMYLTLNQVGGSIASEEAVGRRILIPNAMLFSTVAINYTVNHDAPYILDEVVVRITFSSDWDLAEQILLAAAYDVTSDIIAETGRKPYVRSQSYDYGVYMRLRYLTAVQRRAETSYEIEKRIFQAIQATPAVDIAIPYVYSYRSAMEDVK